MKIEINKLSLDISEENSIKEHYKYFQNNECEYFPCHDIKEEYFNCLFCYCPLYTLGDKCGGNFEYLENGVKSCNLCNIPHTKSGYNYIGNYMNQIIEMGKSC